MNGPHVTAHARRDRLKLLDLPNEILGHVFSHLDSQSPFDLALKRQPSPRSTQSLTRPLKHISLLSHRCRAIVLPRLFRHACLDPFRLGPFLRFVQSNHLSHHIDSLVAYLQSPCSHVYPAWWARLLNGVPARTISIICAPHVFAELAGISIWGSDSWAFNMPYQILKLEQSSEAAHRPIPCDSPPNLLVARPWAALTINEGSSLKAYTTYEYFLRRTPSLISSLHHGLSISGDAMFANLLTFSFIAIFPFCNHVDEVLKCVRKMKSLKKLFVKLCPGPESTVLHDEIEEAQGHIDVNDPWNEFDTAWTLVAHTVIYLTMEGALEELRVDDVEMEGVRQGLEESITRRLQQWWSYQGEYSGLWCRSKAGMSKPASG